MQILIEWRNVPVARGTRLHEMVQRTITYVGMMIFCRSLQVSKAPYDITSRVVGRTTLVRSQLTKTTRPRDYRKHCIKTLYMIRYKRQGNNNEDDKKIYTSLPKSGQGSYKKTRTLR